MDLGHQSVGGTNERKAEYINIDAYCHRLVQPVHSSVLPLLESWCRGPRVWVGKLTHPLIAGAVSESFGIFEEPTYTALPPGGGNSVPQEALGDAVAGESVAGHPDTWGRC